MLSIKYFSTSSTGGWYESDPSPSNRSYRVVFLTKKFWAKSSHFFKDFKVKNFFKKKPFMKGSKKIITGHLRVFFLKNSSVVVITVIRVG